MGAVIDRLEQQTKEAERHAARWRKMLDLARELGDEGLAELVSLLRDDEPTAGENGNSGRAYGNRYTAATPGIPRGREALRIIVRERPGIWTLAEIRTELARRGWLTSPKGVETAAKRLCDVNGEGRRIGPGRYVFPANHGEEVAIVSDPSGAAMIASP